MSTSPSRKRQTLAVVMLLVAAACSLTWLLVVRPQRQRVVDGRGALAAKHTSLRQRGWTLERDKLERLLAERLRVLDGNGAGDPGLRLRSEQVRQHATSMLRDRIQKEFQSPEAFVRNASNIDFREAFTSLQRRLAEEGIWLAPEVLNLSEDSSVPYTYQLLLQVWTVGRLVDVVLENRLQVLADPKVRVRSGSGEKAAARIRVQPVEAYYLEGNSPVPTLLGIPVSLRLSGQLDDVRAFLLSLTAAGNFIPPVSVEIYAADPRARHGQGADGGAMARVEVDVTCSAFFAFPGGEVSAPAPGTAAAGARPGGA